MHEASSYKNNSFLTLTYRDKRDCTEAQLQSKMHLPDSNSLVKSHFQKFMKRLRKKYPETKIRYFHCGEYGEKNNRPHYHACLFNLAFPDEVLYSHNQGNPLYTSKTLEKLWQRGFCTIGSLTYESAKYVSGYILKKITGLQAHDHYQRHDDYGNSYWLQPEYITMSTGTKKGDGIGANWFKTYHQDVFPSDDLPIPGVGIIRGIPRYYESLMEDINPGALEQAKKIRAQFAKSHPELYTPAHLKSQYKIYKSNMKAREL